MFFHDLLLICQCALYSSFAAMILALATLLYVGIKAVGWRM